MFSSAEYNEGYMAAYGQKSLDDNPYAVGTREYDSWLDGYTDIDPWAVEDRAAKLFWKSMGRQDG